jgi:ectoine hydroxylase-related dioxygenase (phytanoyl-CoA dioxygenase family)
MVDNDYFITPPRTSTHAHWHHDVGMAGVYHPRSIMMVKVFYLLTDVSPDGGGTAVIPGSHRFPMDFKLPHVENPAEMPGHVKMAYPAGTAWLFNGRTYHAALHNSSDQRRQVLIYNYGHFFMKPWQGYEPSPAIQAKARTAAMKQLLHIGDAYGQHLTE